MEASRRIVGYFRLPNHTLTYGSKIGHDCVTASDGAVESQLSDRPRPTFTYTELSCAIPVLAGRV